MPSSALTHNTVPLHIHPPLPNHARQFLPAPRHSVQTIIQARLNIHIWTKPVPIPNNMVPQSMEGREKPGTRREMGAADPAAAVRPEEEGTGTGVVGGRRPDAGAHWDAVSSLEDVVGEVGGTDVGVGGG